MFAVSFTCLISDTTLCGKVRNAFNKAGTIISNNIVLTAPVTVNATFLDFCKTMGNCGDSVRHLITLGGAAPANSISMVDTTDNQTRLYPQALVKQLPTKRKRNFNQFDIFAQFNSQGNFWFEGDGPIGQGQSDFLFVILHELTHGLGFASSWSQTYDGGLTPEINARTSDGQDVIFAGFQEYAFDQYMVILPTLQRTTELTQLMNAFNGRTRFANTQTFTAAFTSSPQGQMAAKMLQLAQTSKSLGFMPRVERLLTTSSY